ncbi:MAG: gamma-glutamyltransferase [Deltaproteobacteria bacterium]|nr:gamma-glutamyltransferase [Deltaproteobacteria bacterium]
MALSSFIGKNNMVVGGHQIATSTGHRILEQGGNAIDAMVAMYGVMALVKPDMAGPFGAGWALIYTPKEGKVVAIDMDAKAPAAASVEGMIKAFKEVGWKGSRNASSPMARGIKAIGVPGVLKGWESMLAKYGTMSLAEVLQPAIEYAEKGWAVNKRMPRYFRIFQNSLPIYPGWLETFSVDGRAPKAGEILYNKNLAKSYKLIAAQGTDVFYKGEMGDRIAKFFKENNGWITKKDLENYDVIWSDPLKMTYTASDGSVYTIYGNQPPSSSIEFMQTLKILEGRNLKKMGLNSVEYLHTVIEASKLAHLDNYRYVGDPAFVDVPVDKMLSKKYASELRAKINPNKALKVKFKAEYPLDHKRADAVYENNYDKPRIGATTHSVVADKFGNIISMTNTNGSIWGSAVVVGDTGMLANNGIDWFDLKHSPWTGEATASILEPNKRNRWTLAPVMVFKDGKPFMAVGAAGAEMTAQGMVQPFLNVVEFGMDMQKAIEVPRFRWGGILHYEGETRLFLETNWEGMVISKKVRKGLKAKGHKLVPVKEAGPNPMTGFTNAISILPNRTYESGFGHRPGMMNWAIGD